MKSRLGVSALMSLAAFSVLPCCAARAQEEQDTTGKQQIERFCERAKRDKAVVTEKSKRMENIVALQDCGDEGVALLADYWRNPGSDKETVGTLASVSSRLNDVRIYRAARSVALDPAQADDSRLSALSVLVSGYDPSLAVAFPAPTTPMRTTYVALGHTSHSNQQQGRQPVKGFAKQDLPKVLEQLARSDQSERMQKVAQELGPLLVRRDSLKAGK